MELEGTDRRTISLPGSQRSMLADVVSRAARDVPIVLLLFSAGPLNIAVADAAENVRAILQCTFPAQTAGLAIFQVSLTIYYFPFLIGKF